LEILQLHTIYLPTTVVSSAKWRNDSSKGGRAMPRSVTMAVTYFAGVTSNAGFSTWTPWGVTALPAK
jgi:hypothetical protein